MKETPRIGHVAIAASAGTGKTFQLAHRFIRLMALDVAPDRMVALTFSRKAAGEIFDSIVGYTVKACASPKAAAQAAERIELPGLGPKDFLGLLRRLLDAMPRLRIGTLDSFTVGIVKAFPVELGMPMDFAVTDNNGAGAVCARNAVFEEIFDHRGLDPDAQRRFIEAFKQATFGQEEKQLGKLLDGYVERHRVEFQSLPNSAAWGAEERIWPGGMPWAVLRADGERKALLAVVEQALASNGWPDEVQAAVGGFASFAAAYDDYSAWDVKGLAKKIPSALLQAGQELASGGLELSFKKKVYTIVPPMAGALARLRDHVLGVEIRRALQTTQGLARVLERFETQYDAYIRREGVLTFSDVQALLTPANARSGGRLLSRERNDPQRLYIDYRLDGELDHWLLDEFQDTSDLQWAALSNLLDEVLQDTTGRRSFFYVGDVKQAIYGWRGGNARLFGNILAQYGARIEEKPINTSYRSCQPVIDTVNRLFAPLPSPPLPAATTREWEKIWTPHRCAAGVVPDVGYAALLEALPSEGQPKPDDEDVRRTVAAVLRETDPLRRGFTTAILVRSNAEGVAMVDFLRAQHLEMPIAHEGQSEINENPVVLLLADLARYAAHPGDTVAFEHLRMSPLAAALEDGAARPREDLALRLLEEIAEEGFAPFFRRWGAVLHAAQPLDAFGLKRLDDLTEAAARFDRESPRDIDAFLSYLESYKQQEPSAERAVRVMTIHQAKGLGFDLVLLPQGGHNAMTREPQPDVRLACDPDTCEPQWALRFPRRDVAEADETLRRQLELADEEASFSELCVLYVAMTRAKRALYMVAGYPGPSATSFTSASMLRLQLAGDAKAQAPEEARRDYGGERVGVLYEAGQANWYGRTAAPAAEAPPPRPAWPASYRVSAGGRRRLMRVSPSIQAGNEESAANLFSEHTLGSLSFGTSLHALFEQVEWAETSDAAAITAAWQAGATEEPELRDAIVRQFRTAFASAAFQKALARPEAPGVELWREKRFEIVLGREWVTGSFDRVVLRRDDAGRLLGADILDYKSNQVEGEAALRETAEHYRPQLDLYARALSRMLGLPPKAIGRHLLFTHPARVITLAAGGEIKRD